MAVPVGKIALSTIVVVAGFSLVAMGAPPEVAIEAINYTDQFDYSWTCGAETVEFYQWSDTNGDGIVQESEKLWRGTFNAESVYKDPFNSGVPMHDGVLNAFLNEYNSYYRLGYCPR